MENYPLYQSTKGLFTKEDADAMSKLRIIQKNLVHVQGIPEYIYDHSLLSQQEYLSQYGKICKLVLASKTDQSTNKKTHSAYVTYSSSREAACAILAIDSIIINGHFIRAFFGTSKYCNYFLSNLTCFNKDKCLFIHYIAHHKEIISSNTNFGYAEHLVLAREISNVDNLQVRKALSNFVSPNKPIFPSIQSVIAKEQSFKTKKKIKHNPTIYKSKDKSRFFDCDDETCSHLMNNHSNSIPDYILKVIDELLLRFSFFKQFSNIISPEAFAIEYCKAKYCNYIEDSWYHFIFNTYE